MHTLHLPGIVTPLSDFDLGSKFLRMFFVGLRVYKHLWLQAWHVLKSNSSALWRRASQTELGFFFAVLAYLYLAYLLHVGFDGESNAADRRRSRLSFKPFKTLDCRPAMLLHVHEPLWALMYHQPQLNKYNKKENAIFLQMRFQCSALLYCTVSFFPATSARSQRWPTSQQHPMVSYLQWRIIAVVLTSLLISVCCQLRKSSQAQKTTASVIGRKVSLSSRFSRPSAGMDFSICSVRV